MLRDDGNGRYALSYREYAALRSLFGAKNALVQNYKEIEDRVRLIPNGWRDLNMIMKVLDKLVLALLRTVPTEKLIAIKRELECTYCELKVRNSLTTLPDSCTYVPEGALMNIVNELAEIKCFGCDKTHKDARKTCQLYKDIQACYHYEFEKCGDCPFSDLSKVSDAV